ncbi:putative TAM domain methyltransferase [Colletotrichum sublineola]|uniref:Putative TAM domain methyltransferase n=1 Tax=Colletotrichum sublineola TaxID=1173701 RepID=A0A066XIN7_COLSU|nr:putative TAM domain methyltransferase [Colletotrichum sublineola]
MERLDDDKDSVIFIIGDDAASETDEFERTITTSSNVDPWDVNEDDDSCSTTSRTYLGQGMIIASRKVSVSTLDTYVKPGGIIIVRGFNLRLQDEHGEPLDDDNPAQKLFKSTLTAEMAERNDLPSDDELIHRQMMKEAGLFIVEGETRLTPVNSWPTETHAKRKGAETEKIIGETLEQLCHGPFVEDGQFDQEILMECVMSRESLKDPNNRFYIGFSTVFGKKPLSG